MALSKEKKKVLVLEKSNVIGGNCRSYNVSGFRVDTGPHAITWLKKGPPVDLMAVYFDVVPKFEEHGNYFVRDSERLIKFPYTLQALARFNVFSKTDRLLMARAFVDATKNHTLDEPILDRSVTDFLKNYPISKRGLMFIDTLSYFLSGSSMDDTPMWRILSGGGTTHERSRGFRKKISGVMGVVANRHESHQGYPKGGIQSITNSIIASMPETTVIKTEQDVTKIKKSGKLFTITADDEAYESEIVVFAAELRCLENIIENPLSKKYLEKIATLKKSSRTMTLWLGLKRKRPEFDYLGSEVWFDEETPYWAMPTSNYDKNLAPKGMQLIGFGSRILPGESPSKHKEKLLRTIKKVAWRIEKDIVMEHVQVTYPDKASITVGAKFPGPKTPIDGLYAVGTDVDPRSMGITRAAYSVVEMLKELKKDELI